MGVAVLDAEGEGEIVFVAVGALVNLAVESSVGVFGSEVGVSRFGLTAVTARVGVETIASGPASKHPEVIMPNNMKAKILPREFTRRPREQFFMGALPARRGASECLNLNIGGMGQ